MGQFHYEVMREFVECNRFISGKYSQHTDISKWVSCLG